MSNSWDNPYAYPNWGIYDAQPNDKGKIVKAPKQFSDPRYLASHYDPTHWTNYQTAAAFVRDHPRFGLIFNQTHTPFFSGDLDTYKTTDPAIIEMHRQIREWFDTYEEESPNGGTHILGWYGNGPVPRGKKHNSKFVELISGDGTCITRNPLKPLNNKPCEERAEKVRELLRWIEEEERKEERLTLYVKGAGGSVAASVTFPTVSTGEKREEDAYPAPYELYRQELTAADKEICRSAASAVNGEKFKALYLGQWKDEKKSQSQLDQALLNFICFHQWVRQGTRDDVQVGRIFLRSSYGARLLTTHDKGRNYLRTSIGKGWDFQCPAIDLKSGGAR